VVHFAGALKPWQLTYNPQNEQISGNLGSQHEIQREFLLSWWRIMYQRVWPELSKNNQLNDPNNKIDVGVEGQLGAQGGFGFGGSLLNYGSLTSDQGVQAGSAAHRRAWEAGHVDYHGRDSFSHIQQQLERNIGQHQQTYHPAQQRETTPPKQQPKSSLDNIQSTMGSALPTANQGSTNQQVDSTKASSGAGATGSETSKGEK